MNAILKDLEAALQHTVRAGDCDLCGLWDTQLIDGVGACCRDKASAPAVSADAAPRGAGPWTTFPPRCALPCNEHMFAMLAKAQAAVLVLDELLGVVACIELGDSEPTIHLQQPPREGAVSCVLELVLKDGDQRVTVKRARFMGCTLEWRAL